MTLNYRSDRVPGREVAYRVDIPLSGASIPASVSRIDVEIMIAGKRINRSFPSAPNQSYRFTWDGLDGYGRVAQGRQVAIIRIGYVYRGVYRTPGQSGFAFAAAGSTPITGSESRGEVTLWQVVERDLGLTAIDTRAQGVGGWTLSNHHHYSLRSGELNAGDGTRRSVSGNFQRVISKVFDQPTQIDGRDVFLGLYAAIAPDGAFYFAYRARGDEGDRIGQFKNRQFSHFAGNGANENSEGSVPIIDGGPAATATLGGSVRDFRFGPDGSLYFWARCSLRRISPDGVIETVVGSARREGFSGDGGPAKLAQVSCNTSAVDFGLDGSIYFSDTRNYRIRRVSPDGIITTIAGNGSNVYSGDGTPAINAGLYFPLGLVVRDDGTIDFSDLTRVRRITPSGIVRTIFGNGASGFPSNGASAVGAPIYLETDMVLGPDNSIYFYNRYAHLGGSNTIWRLDEKGTALRVAGNGVMTPFRDQDSMTYAGPATLTELGSSRVFGFDKNKNLYISDENVFLRIGQRFNAATTGTYQVASVDGREVYEFDAEGRHLRTIDALTGVVRRQFTYDQDGSVSTVVDDNGTTRIERDSGGRPTVIVSPDGKTTALTVDENGYLASITDPSGATSRLQHSPGGLLQRVERAKGNASTYSYDGDGRLVRTLNAVGGGWQIARASGVASSYEVSMSSAEGRASSFRVESLASGEVLKTTVGPDGLQSTTRTGTGGEQTRVSPDGTRVETVYGPDPRFGMEAAVMARETTRTPLGRQRVETSQRSLTFSDPSDPTSITELVDTTSVNNRAFQSSYLFSSRTQTLTTPLGRATQSTFDEQSRVLSTRIGSLAPSLFTYDVRGRLSGVTLTGVNGARASIVSYDSHGNVASVQDSLGRVESYSYDLAGRLTSRKLSDGRFVGYQYDTNGNLVALTPSGRSAHVFSYDGVDKEDSYTPPALDGVDTVTRYGYNLDKDLTRVDRPDGRSVVFGYSATGRRSRMEIGRGVYQYGYDPTKGQVTSIAAPDGLLLSYTYDGFLPLTTTLSGEVQGTVAATYDNNLWVTSLAVNGVAIGFTYDNDGLLTRAGDVTVGRRTADGLVSTVSLGGIATQHTYNEFGEVVVDATMLGDTPLTRFEYERDAVGRISRKTEVTLGDTVVEQYGYDAAGRLTSVNRGGAVTTWTYDGNGNRTHQNGAPIATYDAQDRLATYGAASYDYTRNGELRNKTQAGTASSFDYDELGNLVRASLPGDVVIDYLLDGRNRRVGKKINGTLVQGLLYQDELRPAAELAADGSVRSRFVYADKGHVPSLMIRDGKSFRIISDHLGSVRLVVDASSGEVAQRISYDTWGQVIGDSSPGFQPFGYAGGLYDQHTGLLRFGARDYDPSVGRWTAKDPIRFGGGDSNLYAYVVGDPVNYLDPDGRLGIPGAVIGAAGGGLYGLVGALISGGSPLVGALSGAASGAVIGFLPLSLANLGIAAHAGGSVGLLANIVAQSIERPFVPLDPKAAVGAYVSGALSGTGGGLTAGVRGGARFCTENAIGMFSTGSDLLIQSFLSPPKGARP
jgi:RHS repeat-associated protein